MCTSMMIRRASSSTRGEVASTSAASRPAVGPADQPAEPERRGDEHDAADRNRQPLAPLRHAEQAVRRRDFPVREHRLVHAQLKVEARASRSRRPPSSRAASARRTPRWRPRSTTRRGSRNTEWRRDQQREQTAFVRKFASQTSGVQGITTVKAVERDARGRRQVQRIDRRLHRNPHAHVASDSASAVNPGAFASDEERRFSGEASRRAHCARSIAGSRGVSATMREAFGLQSREIPRPVVRARIRHPQHAAHRRADRLAIQRIAAGGLSRTPPAPNAAALRNALPTLSGSVTPSSTEHHVSMRDHIAGIVDPPGARRAPGSRDEG